MTSRLAYLRQRTRSKGVLNVLSAISRTRVGGLGTSLLADTAWLQHKLAGGEPDLRVVAIETMSGCNYRCSFCPIGKMPLPSGKMSLDLFEHLLNQLSNFAGEIHLFFMNEPLLDSRLPEMARMAAERTRASVIIQSNGSKLSRELFERLAPHATVIVNDYSRDQSVAARVQALGTSKQGLIVLKRDPDATLTNRAGNLPDRPARKLNKFCVRPFHELFIAHNGKAVLCCQDWGFEAVVGDVTTTPLREVWTGSELARVRASLMRRERSGLCAKCDFPGV